MADQKLDPLLQGILEYAKFLPGRKNHPLEVLVLRGHLLIEREVHRLINNKFQRRKIFDLSRMPFAAVLRLAEALYGSEIPDWAWEDTKQLNVIRNSLAHHLVDNTLPPRIKRFISRFQQRDSKIFEYVENGVNAHLAYSIANLHGQFLRVGHSDSREV